jgi:hypothetical protein
MANFGSLLYNKAEKKWQERLLREQLTAMRRLFEMLYFWSEAE